MNHWHEHHVVLLEGRKICVSRNEVDLNAKLPHRAVPLGNRVWVAHILGWHVRLHHDPELLIVVDHGNLGAVGLVG